MKIQMVARRDMRYGTRRLKAGDSFEATRADARILTAVKRAEPYVRPTADIPAIPEKLKARAAASVTQAPVPPAIQDQTESDDRAPLRAEYQAKFGKKPFHGWDADTLKAKLAEVAPES